MDPGFSNPVLQSQSTFRAILDATARPGTVQPIRDVVDAPPPLSSSAAVIALTLCDHDTPVWLDLPLQSNGLVSEWLRFHCGCPIVAEPRDAAFAFANSAQALPPFDAFNAGTAEYPDRSTTLVLAVERFEAESRLTLAGPGIPRRISFGAAPLPADIRARLVMNRALFPRGIDLLLAGPDGIAALPRSIRIVES